MKNEKPSPQTENLPATTEETEPELPEESPKRVKKVVTDTEARYIISLKSKGLGIRKIAKVTGRACSTIQRCLKKHEEMFEELANVDAYRGFRRDMLTATEYRLLKSVEDPEKIKAANLRDTAYAFREVTQARRLEEGQSTSNVSQQIARVDLDTFRK